MPFLRLKFVVSMDFWGPILLLQLLAKCRAFLYSTHTTTTSQHFPWHFKQHFDMRQMSVSNIALKAMKERPGIVHSGIKKKSNKSRPSKTRGSQFVTRKTKRMKKADIQDLLDTLKSPTCNVYVSQTQLINLATKVPWILRVEKTQVESISRILYQEAGLEDKHLWRFIRRKPEVLRVHVTVLEEKLRFIKSSVDVTTAQLGQMLLRCPGLVLLPVESQLRPAVVFFGGGDGDGNAALRRNVLRWPEILSFDLGQTVVPRLAWMCKQFELDPPRARRLLILLPQLLWLDTENNLEPKLKFLRHKIGLSSKEIGTLVLAYPTLLTLSVEKNIKPKTKFLLAQGMKKETLKNLFLKYPSLLGASLENRIIPRVNHINSLGLDFSEVGLPILFYSDEIFEAWADKVMSSWWSVKNVANVRDAAATEKPSSTSGV